MLFYDWISFFAWFQPNPLQFKVGQSYHIFALYETNAVKTERTTVFEYQLSAHKDQFLQLLLLQLFLQLLLSKQFFMFTS